MGAKYVLLSLVLLIVLSCSPPVLGGNVLSAPTADLEEVGQGELKYYFQSRQPQGELNWGCLPRVNLGLRLASPESGGLFGTAKVGILAESGTGPGLAVGAEINPMERHLYAVFSKQLGRPGLRGHVAWGTGRYAAGMAAVSLVLNPVRVKTERGWAMPSTSAVLAYDGEGWKGGLTAQFSAKLKASVILTDFSRWGLGLSYKLF